MEIPVKYRDAQSFALLTSVIEAMDHIALIEHHQQGELTLHTDESSGAILRELIPLVEGVEIQDLK